MSTLTKSELEKLRNVSIHELLGIKNIGVKQSIKCVFPNHNDNTPSLLIDAQNGYYCFGCKKFGFGAIDFCEDLGMEFKDIVNGLSKHLHEHKN